MKKEFLSQYQYLPKKNSIGAFIKRIYLSIRNRYLLEPTMFLNKNPRYKEWEIGDYTYSGKEGCPDIVKGTEDTKLKIGKFCSIAYNVTFFLGNHRADWVSTYPFSALFEEAAHIEGHPGSKGNVIVGNDVWIGKNATILSGVTIGDGAVVGADSVVTKNVPPYAIVAGNPARIVKMRFDDDTIAELENIQWWNWEISKILSNIHLILSDDMAAFLEQHKSPSKLLGKNDATDLKFNSMLPVVSVIIPTYNYAQYINDAINSVLQQTYPKEKIEIIIVDDGSSDNTKEVVQPFIDAGSIQYYYQENSGKANATKKCIQCSTGKYIFNLDADDYFLKDKIASYVSIFERDESIVHIGSPAKLIFQETKKTTIERLPAEITGKAIDGNELLHKFYKKNILFGGGSTFCARASTLKAIEIPGDVDMYMDEFLLLAVLPFGRSYLFEEAYSIWRIHSSNYSGVNITREKQIVKAARLLKSSSTVLEYMKVNNYDKELINIYHLQDATRRISFKESMGEKTAKDILQYASEIFLTIKPAVGVLKKYHVINRLIPSPLFRMLKKFKMTA